MAKNLHFYIEVKNNTIRFDLHGAKIMKPGGFELRYSFDIDPSERALNSMAIGLLGPIIAKNTKGSVSVALPFAIHSEDIGEWKSYHRLPARLSFSSKGTATAGTVPVRCGIEGNPPIALLHGGGKDSIAALVVACEVYPDAPIHILRLHWNPRSAIEHRDAFEQHSLMKLRESVDFDYFSVESTLHAQLLNRKDAALIHLARYLCSFMPYVEKVQPRFIAHAYDALEFHGSAYRRAHPQIVKHIDRIYAELGSQTKIRNFCFGLPAKANFDMVAKLRPDLVSKIYMCESLESHWCYRCRKCFTYALLCIMHSVRPENFDFDAMFSTENIYIHKIRAALVGASKLEPAPLPLRDLLAYPAHYQALCTWESEVLAGAAAIRLDRTSQSLLRQVFEAIRHHAVSEANMVWRSASAYEGGEAFAQAIESLAARGGLKIMRANSLQGHVHDRPVTYSMSDIE